MLVQARPLDEQPVGVPFAQVLPPPVTDGMHAPLQQSAAFAQPAPGAAHGPPSVVAGAVHFAAAHVPLQHMSSREHEPPTARHDAPTRPFWPKHLSFSQRPSQQWRFCVQASPADEQVTPMPLARQYAVVP